MKYTLTLTTCLLFLLGQLNAQYSETFDVPNKGILAGPCTTNDPATCASSDFAGVDWTLEGNLSGLTAADDNFYTVGGVLRAMDIDEEICWLSPVLNMTGTASFSMDLTWLAFDDYTSPPQTIGSQDYIDVSYRIDGGSWVALPNAVGGGPRTISYATTPTASNVDGSISGLGASGLTGSTLEIRVCVDVNSAQEITTIDNVTATNATTGMAGPVCDLNLVGITATNENCPGATDGSITVNATTSNGPITYTLSGPVSASNQTGVFTDLPPGAYSVALQDGSFAPGNCTETTGPINIAVGMDNNDPTATPPGPVTVDCPADIPAPDPSLVTNVDDNCRIPCVTEPWINEFHYDNIGTDVNEFIEVAGPAGIDLSLYTLYAYDGFNGEFYNFFNLSGIIPDQDNGFGTRFVLTPNLQNTTEGIALVKNGTEVIEFISYEGVVTATDGPAMGMTSVDVGVSESTMSTPEDGSLGRVGNGNKPGDFTWAVLTQTQGNLNTGQTITNCPDNEPTVAHFGDTNNGGSGSSADPYILTRTYRVTDAYGNSTDITQTLTANNCCTAPTVSVAAAASPICPGETASFNLTGTPNATVTYNINGGGSQMLTLDANGMATVEVPNAAASQTLNLVAVDLNSCPQSLSESATVVVEDNEDPTITCPGPIEVTCLEDIPPADINLPIVGDNCQGPLTVTHEGDVLQAPGSFLFTSAGATGHLGPNQAMLDMAYASTNLSGKVTSVDGIQYWEVPSTGTYQIEALGGQGYGPFGGRGAYISGEFNLQAGDMLKILVGQAAGPYLNFPSTTYNHQYGGGGGSFVTTSTNTPLVVAGGGGGSHRSEYNPLCDAQTGTAGAAGSFGNIIGAGGTNGLGGQQASSADGGGGLLGNGDGIAGGFAFVNGGRGGIDEGTGGFGGGGGTSSWNNYRGGGGGGYSGGGGGNNEALCCPSGGGGGSYNGGSNQMGLAGMGLGDGQVEITTLSAVGSVLRTYRVTDASGNFAECTQTIVINDMTPPTAICPSTAPTVALDGSGNGTLAENALAGGNSTDNCAAGVTETSPLTNFTCANAPSAMVVLTATDAAGNMHTVNCTVNIVDGEDPVAICPTTAPTVILDGSGNGTLAENALAGGNSTDNCSVTETSPLTNFTCANSPSAMVVLTATDAAGNMHTVNCTVNIVDDEDPVAICPTTAPTVILDGTGNGTLAENALAGGNSTDNCSVTETSPLTNFTCANAPSAMVVLTATDAAGNMHTANCTVNIVDDEDPTASCDNITVQLDANRTASITAADIDGGSTDNCGSVSLSISGATTFDCDDVGTPQVATLTVTDGSNNSSECDATVTVADDDNPCTTIFGNIVWEHDRIANPIGVPDASVALTGDDTGSDNTDMSGDYAIPTAGGNLTLTPTKTTGDPYEGVTAADVTRIQQHVTFIDQLDDGYKVIAADVNQSNSVTGLDAAVIFHAINGNPSAQAIFETPSWRFVDSTHTFVAENAPWPFPEDISLMNVMADVLNQSFVGVKMGDVNGTWATPVPLTSPPLSLMVQDVALKAGQTLRIPFRANGLPDVAAWQFALRFDTDYLRFERALPTAAFPLKSDNFGAWQADRGELRSVFAVPQGLALPKDEIIFELAFQVVHDGLRLSEVLRLDDGILDGRVYNTALSGGAVALSFERDSKLPNMDLPGEHALGFALEQNIPNPFGGETLIRFQLPEAGETVFSVHDVQGRLLYEQRGFFDAGLHEIQLDAARLGTTGVLSYTLHCGAQSATRRMVLVR